MQKVYFLRLMPVCFGLIIVAVNFCRSYLTQMEYNCSLIKVDWLDACIALREVGAVSFVFLRRWRKIAQSSSQWEARADTRRNLTKPC
jgi:hypothetical protein